MGLFKRLRRAFTQEPEEYVEQPQQEEQPNFDTWWQEPISDDELDQLFSPIEQEQEQRKPRWGR